jgi:hypothetical protein
MRPAIAVASLLWLAGCGTDEGGAPMAFCDPQDNGKTWTCVPGIM